MATLVIKNIGKIVSGDIDHPVLEGSVIVINENLIEAIPGSLGHACACLHGGRLRHPSEDLWLH